MAENKIETADQRSVTDQLRDGIDYANARGMYDAAECIALKVGTDELATIRANRAEDKSETSDGESDAARRLRNIDDALFGPLAMAEVTEAIADELEKDEPEIDLHDVSVLREAAELIRAAYT